MAIREGLGMKVRESGMPEEPLWSTFFNPDQILSVLQFDRPNADVIEFGCGYGTFTVAVARRTSGSVYALDIEPAMISATAEKVRTAGVPNVRLMERDFIASGTGLPAHSVDYAMLFNILHAPEPIALLQEAVRVLRTGGKVAVIHWNPTETPRGPDLSIRPHPEKCAAWILEAGLNLVLPATDLPPYHFGLVGVKPDKTD